MNFEQIRQAQQLKSKLDRAQKELKKMQIEGEAGKGAVTVVVNGEQRIISVKIAPEVIDPKNVKQLEQLVENGHLVINADANVTRSGNNVNYYFRLMTDYCEPTKPSGSDLYYTLTSLL